MAYMSNLEALYCYWIEIVYITSIVGSSVRFVFISILDSNKIEWHNTWRLNRVWFHSLTSNYI